jgi:hypothetical protein
MQHQHSDNVCAHTGCNCARREDSKYCSPYCEAAGDTLELACNCGHVGCGVEGTFREDAELIGQKA